MRKRVLWAAPILLQSCALAPEPVGDAPIRVEDARVLAVDELPFGPGIVYPWNVLTVSSRRYGQLDVLIPQGQKPPIGALCVMTAQRRTIEGLLPARDVGDHPLMASALECGGKIYPV